MTEYFRIEGENLIDFDREMVSGAHPIYNLKTGIPPKGMSDPLTRAEILVHLRELPLGVRGHALNRGMSMVTFPFDIQADSDVEMEQALHDLKETLNRGQLYIESEGSRGTRMVVHTKANAAVEHSYKTIYYGELDESTARRVLGPEIKTHLLVGLQLTLYMQPKWQPETAIALGPNEIYCPGFEEDGNGDGLADNWNILNVPTLTMENDIVLQGFYSQKIVTRNIIGDGIQSDVFVAPAATTKCIAYAWIARPVAGSDIIVEVYDSTAPAVKGSALYNTGGWQTKLAADGATTFSRVEVPVAAGIVAGNNHRMRIYNTAATVTTLYVDKVFWKWGTTDVPVEWSDHPLIYNHYDTTEGAAHEGHQNYFDVCDLKGTDEARLLMLVTNEQQADQNAYGDLVVARRNWWEERAREPGGAPPDETENHWLEAEDADVLTTWAAMGGLARCSAGDCISNAANVSGSAQWWFHADPPGGGLWRSMAIRGTYDVFAVVYTDDAIHTQYRLSYSNFAIGPALTFYNRWIKQPLSSRWQLVYLGEIHFDKYMRPAMLTAGDCWIEVEYLKDAADTVRLDCLWLLSRKDPTTRLHAVDPDWLATAYRYAFDRTEDFDYEEKEADTGIALLTMLGELCLQGDEMTLSPKRVRGQRLYFSAESVDIVPAPDEREWEAHGAVNPLRWEVDISYVPQYQTPLD